MKIVILAAMDKEVALLKGLLSNSVATRIEDVDVLEGEIGRHSIVLAKCGIGKVNAALNTFKIVKHFSPDLVINSGVAGGAGNSRIGDLLVADAVAYYDVWCGPGTEWGAADGFPRVFTPCRKVIDIVRNDVEAKNVVYGLIATGDKFVSTAEEVAFVRSHFPDAIAVDMESAAIAQTCTSLGVEFNILRVVSDTPGEADNLSQYQNFWSEAPAATFACISAILNAL